MNKRLAMPDGVRVLAIGLIMWFHIWQQSWLEPVVTLGSFRLDLSAAARTGYIMVDIMLMLSGFLLFLPLARGGEMRITEFYKKRLLRIVPCYLLSVMVMLLAFALPGHEYSSKSAMWKDLLTHLTFTHTFFPATYTYTRLNVVLWTVAIEMQFYLIFPLLARAFRARPMLSYLVMVAVALGFRKFAAGREDIDMYLNQLPAMLDVYANGMLAALMLAELEKLEKGRFTRLFFTAIVLLALAQVWRIMRAQYADSFPMEARKLAQLDNRFELSAWGAVILVAGENAVDWIRNVFGCRLMGFLSGISFNAYIWHQVLAVKLKEWHIPAYLSDSPNAAGEMPWQRTYTLLCFALALALAAIVTYAFERPVGRVLKDVWDRRLGNKSKT